METIHLLAKRLADDFPNVKLQISADHCAWDARERHILYAPDSQPAELLHELGHALLGHNSYERDIELLGIERAAWEYAVTILAPRYHISIDDETVEEALDTYRDWLHRRSTCPACKLNGIQESATVYRCVHCRQRWSVNEAKTCRLKRTPLSKNNK